MSTHTPGPWIVTGDKDQLIRALDGSLLADFGFGKSVEQANANGRLIAAAPDLLMTLVMAWDALRDFQFGSGTKEFAGAMADKCAAAIDKATEAT